MVAAVIGRKYFFTVADVIIIAVLLVIIVSGWISAARHMTALGFASKVQIITNRGIVAEYSLRSDGVYDFYQSNGSYNQVTIADGKVYMSAANCPDHSCQMMIISDYVGREIVCLPNQFVIKICGDNKEWDAVL